MFQLRTQTEYGNNCNNIFLDTGRPPSSTGISRYDFGMNYRLKQVTILITDMSYGYVFSYALDRLA